MDGQLKRGLLEVCVLAAIKTGDSYGYQIIKDMKPYVEISESTLYPILRRLEAAECLTVRTAEHSGRLRKYYHITPLGIQRIEAFKKELPTKTIWLWTGYKFEDIIKDPAKYKVLEYIDVLIDGRFEEDLKDITLKYCGSSNQRVIDVKKSLLKNEVVLYSET